MSVSLQRTNTNFQDMKNITQIKEPKDVLSHLAQLIRDAFTAISFAFVFGGLMLLFGTLTDEEGLVQVFVWLVFSAVILGFIMIVVVGGQCMIQPSCLLNDVDWLTAAAGLLFVAIYLGSWIYFISVANSYVVVH